MRSFVLIAALVLASASAQAGESRSLTGLTVNDAPSAPNVQPRANDALRAENTTPSTPSTPSTTPADTPRYSVPSTEAPQPVEPTRNTTETPRYSPRLAPINTAPTTASQQPPSDTTERPTRTRHARAERPHYRGRVTTGQIIAALHRYGIYW